VLGGFMNLFKKGMRDDVEDENASGQMSEDSEDARDKAALKEDKPKVVAADSIKGLQERELKLLATMKPGPKFDIAQLDDNLYYKPTQPGRKKTSGDGDEMLGL
jgi:hypothetical protein